jgi:hypothetical protein
MSPNFKIGGLVEDRQLWRLSPITEFAPEEDFSFTTATLVVRERAADDMQYLIKRSEAPVMML